MWRSPPVIIRLHDDINDVPETYLESGAYAVDEIWRIQCRQAHRRSIDILMLRKAAPLKTIWGFPIFQAKK